MKSDSDINDEPFTVGLFAALPEFGNMGCNALTVSLMKLIVESRPNSMFYFLDRLRHRISKEIEIAGKTVPMVLVNCRLTPKAKLKENLFWIYFLALVYRVLPLEVIRDYICRSNPWIRILVEANVVGNHFYGDSFSDTYGIRRLVNYSLLTATSIMMGRKLVLFPQTYGPFESRTARLIARFILSHASHIFARDKKDLEVVQTLISRRAKPDVIQFCPDLAFVLDAIPPNSDSVRPPLNLERNYPLVGLNVSGLLYNGGYSRNNMFGLKCDYKRTVVDLVGMFLQSTEAHILLVPHVFSEDVESDNGACREVLQTVPVCYRDRVHLVAQRYNQNEIKGIIGLCDFFIGSRMHACIAALSQRIPTVGIAYSKKFSGVFESVGMRNMVIDARELTSEQILSSCNSYYKSREAAANELERAIPEIQARVTTCIQGLT